VNLRLKNGLEVNLIHTLIRWTAGRGRSDVVNTYRSFRIFDAAN